ncbi:lysophospholipid acyltransferase family protein [Rhodanobacter sp. 115]|uniref:lysophospholipid acyltransferase family protein n=1 Tax=Rhodanobacter sp. FW021-MT20 TaxID=1162282 RepID=UPI001ED94739|nr:lysophospholipid acyltransferase family protein [Rhodanobacter sp. 115]
MESTPLELATQPLNRRTDAWAVRLVATGASFVLFGLGGLLLWIFLLPVLACLPGGVMARRRRARAAISRAFRLHAWFMRRSGVLTLHIDGVQRLGQPGQMIVANHPSLIDVVFLIGQLRDTNCIVKAGLFRNPCMRGPVRAAQYISNDGSMTMLERAADVLREGQSLLVFPEARAPRRAARRCSIAVRRPSPCVARVASRRCSSPSNPPR